MALMLISSAFAFSRSISGTQITYTASTAFSSSLPKGYWAVEDVLPGTGCSITNVAKTSCGTNCEYSISSNTIKLVAYTPESGGTVGNSKSITVAGSGSSCTLTGNYAEAPGTAGTKTAMSSGTISFGGGACSNQADSNSNCKIENSELLNYITAWINGSVTNPQLLSTISIWVNGGY